MFITPNEQPVVPFRSDGYMRISLVICMAGILLMGLVSFVQGGIALLSYGMDRPCRRAPKVLPLLGSSFYLQNSREYPRLRDLRRELIKAFCRGGAPIQDRRVRIAEFFCFLVEENG